MSVGLERVVQTDFGAGIFRGSRPERTPVNALYDCVNGLYSDDGAVYRRGGSTYRANAFGSGLTFVWDGLLTGGQRTVIATSSAMATVDTAGVVTAVTGGTGLSEPRRAATYLGVLYLPGGQTYNGTAVGTAPLARRFYATVGNRLWMAENDRVDFTGIGVTTFAATDFHRLPEGVEILGVEGLRDSVALFTTRGVWVISNVAFNLTDTAGNVQHRVDQYSRELVLWGEAGIAGWEGALVVPGVDGVWLMSRGVSGEAATPFQRISDPISVLYQGYVRSGYKPGLAVVHDGHYVLPILDAANVVRDTLVCRLNLPGRPWSRLAGFGARVTALAIRTLASARKPELLGAGTRLLTLNYLTPGGADADGSWPLLEATTRDIGTGRRAANTIVKATAGYELASTTVGASMSAHYVTGRPLAGQSEWGLFDWGVGTWGAAGDETIRLEGDAPVDTYGSTPFSWPVRKRVGYARFRLSCSSPASRVTVRSFELHVRPSGRP